jgi:hypothetical protein
MSEDDLVVIDKVECFNENSERIEEQLNDHGIDLILRIVGVVNSAGNICMVVFCDDCSIGAKRQTRPFTIKGCWGDTLDVTLITIPINLEANGFSRDYWLTKDAPVEITYDYYYKLAAHKAGACNSCKPGKISYWCEQLLLMSEEDIVADELNLSAHYLLNQLGVSSPNPDNYPREEKGKKSFGKIFGSAFYEAHEKFERLKRSLYLTKEQQQQEEEKESQRKELFKEETEELSEERQRKLKAFFERIKKKEEEEVRTDEKTDNPPG